MSSETKCNDLVFRERTFSDAFQMIPPSSRWRLKEERKWMCIEPWIKTHKHRTTNCFDNIETINYKLLIDQLSMPYDYATGERVDHKLDDWVQRAQRFQWWAPRCDIIGDGYPSALFREWKYGVWPRRPNNEEEEQEEINQMVFHDHMYSLPERYVVIIPRPSCIQTIEVRPPRPYGGSGTYSYHTGTFVVEPIVILRESDVFVRTVSSIDSKL